MNGRFLVDTNIVVAFLEGESSVQTRFTEAEAIFVPSIVIGELYYGAYKSGRVTANITRVDEFIPRYTILACDAVTALLYGQIKNLLRQKGRPIPENDIWIAAIAMQYQLTLVSRDSDFQYVDQLMVEIW
ncbi:type II toxin-antitoxin system VapC family toxin [Floridanema aerugineum]|jgi:tRNA(fMet)-specific endonuclease VapC|uniref:Ribonuclease VapC n=1 Tax=Floridaenema aerugineum BLCC-F46 TaxID=3153654 RepID=A0ABV4XCF8_9CYAN